MDYHFASCFVMILVKKIPKYFVDTEMLQSINNPLTWK